MTRISRLSGVALFGLLAACQVTAPPPEPAFRAPSPAYPGGYSPYYVTPGSEPAPPLRVIQPAKPDPARTQAAARAEPEPAAEPVKDEPKKDGVAPVPVSDSQREAQQARIPGPDEPPLPAAAPLPLVEKAPIGAICHEVPRAVIEGKWIRQVCRGNDGKWAYVAD